MGDEQTMLVCTLLPFKDEVIDPSTLTEATVTVNWRTHEIRFCGPGGCSVVINLARQRHVAWVNLIGLSYCKLTALMKTVTGPQGPVILEPAAIRLYMVRDAMQNALTEKLCDPNFMAFETLVAGTLRDSKYMIEPTGTESRRRVTWDLGVRQLEFTPGVQVCEGLWWSFTDLGFCTEQPTAVKHTMRPTVLVSEACTQWKDTILSQCSLAATASGPRRRLPSSNGGPDGFLAAPLTTVVVTTRPERWHTNGSSEAAREWPTGPSVLLDSRGVPVRDLAGPLTVIATPETITANVVAATNLLDAVSVATESVMASTRSDAQLRRVLVQNLASKLLTFVLPLDFLHVGLVLLDDAEALKATSCLGLMSSRMASRWVQVFYDRERTKPVGLTWSQTASALSLSGSPAYAGHLAHASAQAAIQIVPVSKTLLRKIKVFPHLVKYGAAEERIQKAFATKWCPLPLNDALQRFSGKKMPTSAAEDLLKRHFQRLQISLASFLSAATDTAPEPLSESYVVGALNATKHTCSICFESVSSPGSDGPFSFTLCGHTYCNDCSKQHFSADWAQGKSKECACCRCPLIGGDVFMIDNSQPHAPAVASKSAAVASFLGALKSSNCYRYWPSASEPTMPELKPIRGSTKALVITDVPTVGLRGAFDIIKTFGGHSLSVHVFYSASEAPSYQSFMEAF